MGRKANTVSKLTAFSGVALVGTRLHFGTFAENGAFIQLDTKAPVYGIGKDTKFLSQRKAVNLMKHRGGVNIRAGAMSLATINPNPARMYQSPMEFISEATVGRAVSDTDKAILIANVAEFYEFEIE